MKLDWYIKWAASLLLIAGNFMTAANLTYNIPVIMLGLFGWLIVSLMWKDKSLIILNGSGLALMAYGLLIN